MRFIKARSDAEVERRFAEAFNSAKAWHEPKKLSEDMRLYRERRFLASRPQQRESDGSDVIEFFKNHGVRIIDETKTRH
jgi:hypothetical protein